MKKLILFTFLVVLATAISLIAYKQALAGEYPEVNVKVMVIPSGVGTISSTDGKLNCTSTCQTTYNHDDTITLNFSPSTSRTFKNWLAWTGSEGCPATYTTTTCSFTVDWYEAAQPGVLLYAISVYDTYTLKAVKTGTGTGTISGAGNYSYSQIVNRIAKLTATADSGSKFIGWETSGDTCYSWKLVNGEYVKARNTKAVCNNFVYEYEWPQTLKVVARFDKISTNTGNITTATDDGSPTGPPTEPKVSEVLIGGEKIDITKPVAVTQDKPLVLSGKTIANATVKLYIFSDPITATTKADKNGNWSYTISGLPEGEHRVEAEVTDPATKKTSKRAKILAFTVTASAGSAATQPHIAEYTKISDRVLLAGGILLLAALGGGIWYWLYKKKLNPISYLRSKI